MVLQTLSHKALSVICTISKKELKNDSQTLSQAGPFIKFKYTSKKYKIF